MLDVLPWFEVLTTALRGTGDCAAVVWRFLGISIPGWTALFFALLILVGLVMMFRRYRPKSWLLR
jgi:disulfide bond formation protein DsbB